MPTRNKNKEYNDAWSSEDIGNPVYSKKKPLSDKEARKILIEDRQKRGAQYFNKGAHMLYGGARLVPGVLGSITDIIDFGWDNADLGDKANITSTALNQLGKTMGGIISEESLKNAILNQKSIFPSKLIKGIKGIDFVSDAKQLYNTIMTPIDEFKYGGTVMAKSKIKIKPENKGKFTAYCGGKVTQKCITKGKNSPSATIRKRATFAANARKWKHAYGGEVLDDVPVEVEGGEVIQVPGMEADQVTGASHEQGGIDMNLPQGTQIFSDRISVDGMSLADRKTKRDKRINKLSKLLEKDDIQDNLVKNTLRRSTELAALEEEQDIRLMQAMNNPLEQDSERPQYQYGTSYLTQPDKFQFNLPGNNLQSLLNIPLTPTANNIRNNALNTSNINTGTELVQNQPSALDAIGGSMGLAGSITGLASTVLGGIAGVQNTKQALEATKDLNQDYYEDFGLASLQTIGQAKDQAAANKASRRRQISDQLAIQRNTQRERNRGSAMGINTLRALDTVTDLGLDRATTEAYNQLEQLYGSEIMQLLGQESELGLQRDYYTSASKERLQEAQEQRLDNFYSNIGQDIQSMYGGLGQMGANLSQLARNQAELGYMGEGSEYFIPKATGLGNKYSQRRKKLR